LAITDILYKKVRADEGENESDNCENNKICDKNVKVIFDDIIEEKFPKSKTKFFRKYIRSALDISQKLIKFFKRSTVRDPILQKHVREYLKKELK
jgi:hypothetical protein